MAGEGSILVQEVRTEKPSRKWLATGFFAAALPIIFLIFLLYRYAVDVPAWDDWDTAPIVARAHSGQSFLYDLFRQQQEARTVIPKALVVLLAAFGHWHLTYEMALSVVISAATVIGVYLLLRQSLLGPAAIAICLFLTALLAFSPAYYEVWLTGSDFSSFLPAFWLVAALVIIGTPLSITRKFVWCSLLALASSFSLAHGLLLWAITFPIVLLRESVPNWKRWLFLWITICAGCLIIYFWDYQKPSHLPLFAPAVPVTNYFVYIFIFLGSPLVCAGTNAPITLAAILGGSGFVLFCGLVCYVVWRSPKKELLRPYLPWIALGFYALGAAGLAAFGRVGFGMRQALQSRYGPFALYLFVALVGLTAVMTSDQGLARSSRLRRFWNSIVFLLMLSLLIPILLSTKAGVDAMRAGSANNWLGKSAVLFNRAFDTSKTIKKTIYPLPDVLRRDAIALDDLGLIKPALVKTNNISSIRHWGANNENVNGWCESIVPGDNNTLVAKGWAVLTKAGRPADGVVLSYEYPERNWILFALSDEISARPDVVNRTQNREHLWSGWRATFPRSAFPQGARISAWAINAENAAIYRLNNNFLDEKF